MAEEEAEEEDEAAVVVEGRGKKKGKEGGKRRTGRCNCDINGVGVSQAMQLWQRNEINAINTIGGRARPCFDQRETLVCDYTLKTLEIVMAVALIQRLPFRVY